MEKIKDLWKNTKWFKILVFIICISLLFILWQITLISGLIMYGYALYSFVKSKIRGQSTKFKPKTSFIVATSLIFISIIGCIVTPDTTNTDSKSEATPKVTKTSQSITSDSSKKEKQASQKKDTTKKEKQASQKKDTTKKETSVASKPIETTPDKLVEKTNNGTLKSGEKYHFVGEMMNSDNWTTGATGNYTVYVKAPEQSPMTGMMLYADEHDAERWTDGTKVDFIVNIKDIDVDGNKITMPVVKTSKILSGGTTKEQKDSIKENDYYKAMSSAAQTVNTSLGTTAIDSIDKGSVYPVADVKLNIVFASYSNMEIKSLVQTLNESLVKLAHSKGEDYPQFHYYISGVEIGENRSIMDPSKVKFNSNLK